MAAAAMARHAKIASPASVYSCIIVLIAWKERRAITPLPSAGGARASVLRKHAVRG